MISFPEIPLLYQVSTALGVIASLFVSKKYKQQLPLKVDSLQLYYAALFLISVLGAYSIGLFSYLYFGDFRYKKSLIAGILIAWTAAEIIKKAFGIKTSTGDPLAPGMAIGLCFARIGCLFGHCCYGIDYQGTMALEHQGKTYFPSPILEIIFHGLFFFLISYWTKQNLLQGMRLRIYLICYGIFRFFSEFMRPHENILFNLNIFQLLSLILIVEISTVVLLNRKQS
ncbi:MAG: prolipoprotein diacylglyceryl transferase [Proteobacteria bacterium]|nr:prolipoprotein diacylglyceryl transferase [Pseudomonadota bacterium]